MLSLFYYSLFLNNIIQLNEIQFGAWVALAIHDTASVVGAASSIGELSVEVAATLKVARTIWIVPLIIFAAWLYRSKNEGLGFTLFVIFFLIAALLNSFSSLMRLFRAISRRLIEFVF